MLKSAKCDCERIPSIHTYLGLIATESKRDKKIELLKSANKNYPFVQEMLNYGTNPDYRYNIHLSDLFEGEGEEINSREWTTFIKPLFDRLRNREITGNAAKASFEIMTSKYNDDTKRLLLKILNKDFKLGIGRTEFIKVFGEDVMEKRQFEVALAKGYDANKDDIFGGNFFLSRKLDGCRCICMISDEGEIKFFSRNYKEFTTLDVIKNNLKKAGTFNNLKGKVLDGEICLVDKDGNEDFQGIVGLVKRKNFTIENPTYKVFDLLSEKEFWEGNGGSLILSDRQEQIKKWLKDIPTISIVEQIQCSEKSLEELLGVVKEKNWEGLMARKDTYYKNGRTSDLLKIKSFLDAEYIVEEVEIGKLNFNESGQGIKEIECVRAIKINHKGTRVSVGSGINKEDRIKWMKNPSLIVGKKVTVKYFEESKTGDGRYSLRFPTFIGVRDYE